MVHAYSCEDQVVLLLTSFIPSTINMERAVPRGAHNLLTTHAHALPQMHVTCIRSTVSGLFVWTNLRCIVLCNASLCKYLCTPFTCSSDERDFLSDVHALEVFVHMLVPRAKGNLFYHFSVSSTLYSVYNKYLWYMDHTVCTCMLRILCGPKAVRLLKWARLLLMGLIGIRTRLYTRLVAPDNAIPCPQ